jgi:hypothetical protein
VTPDRFAYGTNLERGTSFRERSDASWPSAYDYRLSYLDLANELPALGPACPGRERRVATATRVTATSSSAMQTPRSSPPR